MKNENIKNSRTANLYKAKVKDLGFWEKISLKIAGFMDGVRGLRERMTRGTGSRRISIRRFVAMMSFLPGCLVSFR